MNLPDASGGPGAHDGPMGRASGKDEEYLASTKGLFCVFCLMSLMTLINDTSLFEIV